MDKKRPKKNIRLQDEDLTGFEEILDLLPPKVDPKKSKGKEVAETFEFITYVENEESRLRSLESYCVDKKEMLKDHPQTPKLLDVQKQKRDALISELLAAMETDKKDFQDSLANLWNSFFR